MVLGRSRREGIVVVPAAPGPLRPYPTTRRDDVDEILADLVGPPDDAGPGVADAAVATGGGVAVVAGLVVASPLLLAGGAGVVLVGSVLPARALWRRVERRRLHAERAAALDGGLPLRVSAGPVAALVAAHDDLFATVASDPAAVRPEERAAAHAAVRDVAVVLAGGAPAGDDEVLFVTARAEALRAVVDAVERWRVEEVGAARRARLEARQEVDAAAGGSAVAELRDLARQRAEGGS